MSHYPTATFDPIPENATQPKIRPTQFIFHRQAGLGDLFDFYRQQGVVVESHLWVAKSASRGGVKQYLDTTVRGDANYKANKRPDGTGAVSCEFEGGLDNEPLTDFQIRAAVALLEDAHRLDGIPLDVCTSPDDPGVGWHVMWGAPGSWTPVAKSCPTKPVIAQIPAIIAAAQEDDVITKEEIKAIAQAVWDLQLPRGEASEKARVWLAYTNYKVDLLRAAQDPDAFADKVAARLSLKVGASKADVKAALSEVLREGTDTEA